MVGWNCETFPRCGTLFSPSLDMYVCMWERGEKLTCHFLGLLCVCGLVFGRGGVRMSWRCDATVRFEFLREGLAL